MPDKLKNTHDKVDEAMPEEKISIIDCEVEGSCKSAEELAESKEIGASFIAADAPPGARLFLVFFLGVFVFSLYLLFLIFQPFMHTLIFACVFTALSHPLYVQFMRLTGQRKPIASFLVLATLIFLVFIPIYIFIAGLIPQAKNSLELMNSWLSNAHSGDLISLHVQPLIDLLHERFPDLDLASFDVRKELTAALGSFETMLGFGRALLGNTFKLVLHLLLMLLVMFFLLMDGAELIRKIEYYCPLKPRQTGVIIDSIRQISKAVLVGGFVIAILQGTAGGIAFAFVGVQPFFWGTVMAIASFIPLVGTWVIWLPAAAILFFAGSVKSAIFIVVWGIVVIGGIDNILRPILMRGAAKVPIIFIFLALFGGLNVFGMMGILYGPLILSLAAVMLTIYGEEYQVILRSRPDKNGEDTIKP